jgi:hypothetical protein
MKMKQLKYLENEAIFVEHQFKCLFTYDSLKEIYQAWIKRYGPEVAMPAKAISVMENAGTHGWWIDYEPRVCNLP